MPFSHDASTGTLIIYHIQLFKTLFKTLINRIAEMAGGWGNHIMQDEPSFLVLDSTLVLVTGVLLTVFHPGLYFPRMANTKRAKNETTEAEMTAGESSSEQS